VQGFPRPRVLRALLATHSEHMQAALDWILAAGQDPAMDAPLTAQEPSQVSRQELQQLQQLAAMRQQQQQQQQALVPGWGMGSVAAAGAAGVSAAQGSGMWPAAGPYAGSGGGAGSGSSSSSVLYSSGSGPAGYGNAGPGSQQQQQQQVSAGSSRVVGVAGIMHREAEKSSQTSASLAVAFRDLDALMNMAADMVKLAEKFRGVMGPDGSILLNNTNTVSNSNTDGAAGGSGEQLLLDADTQLQLIAMGIASPVTKASAGARYHQELSRQLADFLAAPLARAGGVLMLPDVYCLFNRARGSELVSPDDLLQACEACPQVRE
jgi:ESCRT-II complex subunit VPS36